MISETTAKALTIKELLARLENHDDVAVRVLVEKVYEQFGYEIHGEV